MISVRYVRADPTGNITCLVLDPVAEKDREKVTAALMTRCEQVGYLEPPAGPGARLRLRMMGGEFCGNAAMSAGALTAFRDGLKPGEETEIPLEVSGARGVVRCRIRALDAGWEGTVEMPSVREIVPYPLAGRKLTRVRMDGITHLITEKREPDRREAEALLSLAAEEIREPALGLLQWDEKEGYMTPLVYVRDSGTMVWESGCGSGSTAVGAWRGIRRKNGETVTEVRQPGGTIRVRAEACGGKIGRVTITGRIALEGETRLSITD